MPAMNQLNSIKSQIQFSLSLDSTDSKSDGEQQKKKTYIGRLVEVKK